MILKFLKLTRKQVDKIMFWLFLEIIVICISNKMDFHPYITEPDSEKLLSTVISKLCLHVCMYASDVSLFETDVSCF